MRKVLPIMLMMAVALLGCTMNRTPGNGQPVTATPSMGPATTSGTSYGNVPMTSNYTVQPSTSVSRADQAAAIMRQHQAYQPRLLGYLNPEPRLYQGMPQAPQQYETGQFVNPAYSANPQITVNSSISSAPYPVITSGGTATVVSSTTGAAVLPGSSGTTGIATGTTAATTSALTASAVNTPTPAITSAATVSPNMASNAIAGTPSTTNANTTTTTGTTATTGTTGTGTTTTPSGTTGRLMIPASASMTAPLTVTQTTSGKILITNGRIRAARP